MKKYYFLAIILFAAQFSVAQIDYNKLKKQGQSIVKQVNAGNNPLSNDEIIEGLREALTVGSNNASKAAAARKAAKCAATYFSPARDAMIEVSKLRNAPANKSMLATVTWISCVGCALIIFSCYSSK